MYFDFHSHKRTIGNSGIYNYRIGIDKTIPIGVRFYTAGIHPWDAASINKTEAMKELEMLLDDPRCIGFGEIGLDKHFGTDLDLQTEVFRSQIELANRSSKKVLIIHCIKAFQEIIAEKKKSKQDLIWVIHGFNGSKELIHSLTNSGFSLSVGGLILNEYSKIYKNIHHIPITKLFLETDEGDYSIDKIYNAASSRLNIDLIALQKQIKKNVNNYVTNLNA